MTLEGIFTKRTATSDYFTNLTKFSFNVSFEKRVMKAVLCKEFTNEFYFGILLGKFLEIQQASSMTEGRAAETKQTHLTPLCTLGSGLIASHCHLFAHFPGKYHFICSEKVHLLT